MTERFYTLGYAHKEARKRFPKTTRPLITYLVRDRGIPVMRFGAMFALDTESFEQLCTALDNYFSKPLKIRGRNVLVSCD
jgi:hypothetical protein